ncbi:lipopolysaccharide assembly LapA domain-containing protein [Paenibacillus sp. NFR01]|uniref:LapA family protein n=1 Tax=Paenibacillus sp. NFR01 TaxID=1566279 RepID=UPI0008C9362A|nr:lipopolysaccharide assembly protein LapA domain-containing protein [Paenibacillus sp. NFR01]SES99884.1 Uncharacterized integral membrane protein [Paenibacillus sp. NFR01]
MKTQWSVILGLIFALVIAIFAVFNVGSVPVDFGFTEVTLPLIVVILGCTLIGGLIVGAFGIVRQFKLQKRIKLLTADLAKANDTIAKLENPPLEPFSGLPDTTAPSI